MLGALFTLVISAPTVGCNTTASVADEAAYAYTLAKEKEKRGATKEAIAAMRAVLVQAPWFLAARLAVAQMEESRGGFIPAYTEYKRLLASTLTQEDRDETRARLRILESRVPALSIYADGERSAAAGDWTAAERAARRVIDEKPSFGLAHRLLGIASAAKKDIAGAAQAYATYIQVDPNSDERAPIENFLRDYEAGAFR